MYFYNYRGRSTGRLIGAVECYCGLRVADYATYGEQEVRYHGLWATYVWDGDTDSPFFTFNNDPDYSLARKQEYLRPLMDTEIARFSNAEYIIQEIGKIPEPTLEQAAALLRQYTHFDADQIALFVPHFLRCGAIHRHYVDWRRDSIQSIGFAPEDGYPGIPDVLVRKPAPQLPYRKFEYPKPMTFAEKWAALTRGAS